MSIVPHIFGSLIALEKSFRLIQRKNITLDTDNLGEILDEMRRAANLIQLQFAKNDVVSANRSLQIFYGLLSMVRPLITEALSDAAGFSREPDRLQANLLH